MGGVAPESCHVTVTGEPAATIAPGVGARNWTSARVKGIMRARRERIRISIALSVDQVCRAIRARAGTKEW